VRIFSLVRPAAESRPRKCQSSFVLRSELLDRRRICLFLHGNLQLACALAPRQNPDRSQPSTSLRACVTYDSFDSHAASIAACAAILPFAPPRSNLFTSSPKFIGSAPPVYSEQRRARPRGTAISALCSSQRGITSAARATSNPLFPVSALQARACFRPNSSCASSTAFGFFRNVSSL